MTLNCDRVPLLVLFDQGCESALQCWLCFVQGFVQDVLACAGAEPDSASEGVDTAVGEAAQVAKTGSTIKTQRKADDPKVCMSTLISRRQLIIFVKNKRQLPANLVCAVVKHLLMSSTASSSTSCVYHLCTEVASRNAELLAIVTVW